MASRMDIRTGKRRIWCLTGVGVIIVVAGVCLLAGYQRKAFAERTHCVGNLVHLRLAKVVCQKELGLADGDPIPDKTLIKCLAMDLGQSDRLKCPSGGTYLVGNAGITPKCSYTNICYTYSFDVSHLRLNRRAWKHSLEP